MKQNKNYKLNKLIYEQIKNKSFANSEEKIEEVIEVIKKILNNKTIKQNGNNKQRTRKTINSQY